MLRWAAGRALPPSAFSAAGGAVSAVEVLWVVSVLNVICLLQNGRIKESLIYVRSEASFGTAV